MQLLERNCAMVELATLPIMHQTIIPEDYIDAMGHMNVMWYTHLFGKASVALFQQVGMDWAYFQSGHGAFALQQFFNYLVEVRFGEEISIRSRVLGRSAKRLHVMHFMTKGTPEVLTTTSEFLSTHVDLGIRRSSPFPEPIAAAIDRLAAEHSALGWDPPVCGIMRP
jgi:acyl-CoA thioester hydrolase